MCPFLCAGVFEKTAIEVKEGFLTIFRLSLRGEGYLELAAVSIWLKLRFHASPIIVLEPVLALFLIPRRY